MPRVAKPGIPLKAYRDSGACKMFLPDVGLVSASPFPTTASKTGSPTFPLYLMGNTGLWLKERLHTQ